MMGRRANPTLIGAFLVGAVVLIVIGILVFARGQFFTEKRTFVLFFDGSVKGLNVGAPVDFQGVRIGTVTDIGVRYLAQENSFRIPVFIEIERDRIKQMGARDTETAQRQFLKSLIDKGLRAQLGTVSLVTGQLFVQLDFHPDTPVKLVGAEPKVPELPTIPTTLQQASAAAQELIEKLDQLPLDQLFANVLGITQGLNQLVNAPELPTLIRSVGNTAAEVQQLVRQVSSQTPRLLDDLGGTATAARTTMTDVQQLVRRVDGRVIPLTDGLKDAIEVARATLKDTQQLVRHVDGRLGPLVDGLTDTSKAARATLSQTQQSVDRDLVPMLQELSATARSIRLLTDYLERNPNALLYGKGSDRR
jgi:paraquat-inducible protein B